jgi:hypothetical protein
MGSTVEGAKLLIGSTASVEAHPSGPIDRVKAILRALGYDLEAAPMTGSR